MSGVAAVAALVERLDVVRLLDRGIGPVKARDRGVSGGQLLLAMAQSQLVGGDSLTALDRQRADAAISHLSAVPAVPATTAAGLARRFTDARLVGLEAANSDLVARAYAMSPAAPSGRLARTVTIDMDSTDVEVYGSKKQGVAYNYAGQRAGRPHLATWAEAGLTVAADLLAGNDDVRPRAAPMLRRALAAIPEPVKAGLAQTGGDQRPRVRADAGYFTAELATGAVEAGCDFAVAAKRNTAMWREYAAISPDAWADAVGMHGAQVAASDYAPAGWPPDTYTIVRRVRVDTDDISADPRSRRRRTIAPEQLTLALDGTATHAYAVSFIVTNIPTNERASTGSADHHGNGKGRFETILDVEAWFRHRTDIEDRIREAKLGAGLRHLPSGHHRVNTVWMWAAVLAGNLSVILQALTGLDTHTRSTIATLRHKLLCVPARIIHHARGLTLRLPPGHQLLATILAKIRELPNTA